MITFHRDGTISVRASTSVMADFLHGAPPRDPLAEFSALSRFLIAQERKDNPSPQIGLALR